VAVLAVVLHVVDASRVAGNHLSQESDGSVKVAAARLVFVIPLLYHAYALSSAVCALVRSMRFRQCEV